MDFRAGPKRMWSPSALVPIVLLGAPSLVLGLDSASGASFYFEHTDSVVRVRPDAGALIMQGYSSGQ